MNESLAQKLGMQTPVSPMRRLAASHGLLTEADIVSEAVARGCFHYLQTENPPASRVAADVLTHEQLALALLATANTYDPWLIRVGAMMLSHPGNRASEIARLAVGEGSEPVVRGIAEAGSRYEPENPFWRELLARFGNAAAGARGVLPHHSRFVSIPGRIGPGKMGSPVWLRPLKSASLGYAA